MKMRTGEWREMQHLLLGATTTEMALLCYRLFYVREGRGFTPSEKRNNRISCTQANHG